jgi:drug/metabolite transporter (DMT)-like permease
MKRGASKLSTTQPVTLRVGLFALLISFFWSGNIVAIKFGLATIPPFWSAFWRMAVAAVAVALWAGLRSQPVLLERGQWSNMLRLTAIFTAQIAIFNMGVSFTSPAYAVILLNGNPVMVNLISHFFVADDRLTWRRVFGLAIAFFGIAYVVFGRPDAELASNPLLGNFLMLISALLLAIRIVYTQQLVQGMDPLRPVIWQMVLSLPIFLFLAVTFEVPLLQPLSYEPVLAIAYQAVVVAGFCFVAWTTLLRKYSAGNLAMYSFSVPIFGVVLAALIFGEAISGRLIFGAAAVAIGISIVTRSKRGEIEADGARA